MDAATKSFRSALINEAARLHRGDIDVNENAEDIAINIFDMVEEYKAMVDPETFRLDDDVEEAQARAADVFIK